VYCTSGLIVWRRRGRRCELRGIWHADQDLRGARLRRLGDAPEEGEAPAHDGCRARANGFDLHAGLVVPAGQRERLERVCRDALRPPVIEERLHLTALSTGRCNSLEARH
jgi:hypothetical protein